jgi:KaiC/GvpD/RAD55 family RecA-like ATPase
MKKKEHAKELQASYKAMVESVEEFVVKEGKTLQQAFVAAEEKLHDAKEISQEKIQRASKELKNNLQILGDAIEGASEAYKEQLKFDLAYVNNSLWEKLQSIANSNTVELMQFTRSLQEQAQTVVSEEHLAAHQEHNQWGSEHALWLDEIELWKNEHDHALSKLADIETALRQHSASLAEHAQAIKAHAEMDHDHESIMKNAEQDPSSQVFEEADEQELASHNAMAKMHIKQAELHHSLKIRHLKVMAMINMLYKEVNKTD